MCNIGEIVDTPIASNGAVVIPTIEAIAAIVMHGRATVVMATTGSRQQRLRSERSLAARLPASLLLGLEGLIPICNGATGSTSPIDHPTIPSSRTMARDVSAYPLTVDAIGTMRGDRFISSASPRSRQRYTSALKEVTNS